jgi:putative sugar O-methyltransferase
MVIDTDLERPELPEMGEDPVMTQMLSEVGSAVAVHRPSAFWSELNAKNARMLAELGISNFKRKVAQNYYNWLVISIRDIQFRSAFKDWLLHPTLRPLTNAMSTPQVLRTTTGLERQVGPFRYWLYKLFVGMLWEHAVRIDRSGLAREIEEPTLGNPILILRKGRRISQDLANSLREYNAILSAEPARREGTIRVAELGAGYGRLAHVFLAGGRCKYFIFDIPPALYVSQWYLTRLFPQKRTFCFRPFTDYAEVAEEIERSEMGFFTPNQMDQFPDGCFDAMASISTLPEMTTEQIRHYLDQMQRLSADIVYLKQWLSWSNPQDGHGVHPGTFDLGPRWRLCLDRKDAIQPLFFERLWRRHRAAPDATS